MPNDMQQADMSPNEAGKEKPEPRQPKKMTLGAEKERGVSPATEGMVEGIPRRGCP